MEANTYIVEPHRLPQRRLWYGFTAAPFAWVLVGVIGVIVSAQFCPADSPNWGIIGQNGVRSALAVVTIALLAMAISGAAVALNNWKLLADSHELIHSEGRTRDAFLSLGGVVLSAVFIVSIIWQGVPLMLLEQCMRAR
jgi:hypothetical protein